MREMQDSNEYVSFTSQKDVPICPPTTTVRQRPPTPAADIEKEWKQIVCAAETVIEGSHSIDEFSDASFERLLASVDSVDSDRQRMVVSTGSNAKTNGMPLSQPLSFANPLFVYKKSARASSGSTSSLDSSVIQKSYSLTSVDESNDIGSTPKATTAVAACSNSPGYSVYSRVDSSARDWKPSQSNECLSDSAGDLVQEQPQMRRSAILSAAGPTPKPLSLSSSLSRSTELSVSRDTEQSKRSSTVSSVVGLDTPPDSPHGVNTYHGANSGRKVTPLQNNVRMGVRSMQRRPVDPEKTKIEARDRPLVYCYVTSAN